MENQKVEDIVNGQNKTVKNVIHFKDVKLQFGSEQIYDNISF